MSLELPPLSPSAFTRPTTEELRARRVDAATFVLSRGRATLVGPDGSAHALVAGQSTLSRAPFHLELGARGELTLVIPGRASARLRGPAAIQGHDSADGGMVWTLFDAELCEVETRAPFHLVLPGGWVGDADASAFTVQARPDGGVDVELRAGAPLRIGRPGAGDATLPVGLVGPGRRLTFSGTVPLRSSARNREPVRPSWEVVEWPFDAPSEQAATPSTSGEHPADRDARAPRPRTPLAEDEGVHVPRDEDRGRVHEAEDGTVDEARPTGNARLEPDATPYAAGPPALEHVERTVVRAPSALEDPKPAARLADRTRTAELAPDRSVDESGPTSLPIELARLRREGNFVFSDSRWLQVETTAAGHSLFRLSESAPHRVACLGPEVDLVLEPGSVVLNAPGHAIEVLAGRVSMQELSAVARQARERGILRPSASAPADDAGFEEPPLAGVELRPLAHGGSALHVPMSATRTLWGATPMQDFVLGPGASAFFDATGRVLATLGSTTAEARAQAGRPEAWWLAWGDECAAEPVAEPRAQRGDPAPISVSPPAEESASASCFELSELLPAAAFEITELGSGCWVAWFDRSQAAFGCLVLPAGRYEFEPGTMALFDERCHLQAFIGTLRFQASSAGSR